MKEQPYAIVVFSKSGNWQTTTTTRNYNIYIQAKIYDASSALASINKIAAQSKAPQNLFVFVSAWQWQWVRKMVIRVIFHFWLGLLLPILLLTTLGRKTAPYLHIDSK
jgi:hypothetical protein